MKVQTTIITHTESSQKQKS